MTNSPAKKRYLGVRLRAAPPPTSSGGRPPCPSTGCRTASPLTPPGHGGSDAGERSHLAGETRRLTGSQVSGASTFRTDLPLESNDTSSGLRTQYRLGSQAAVVLSSSSGMDVLPSRGPVKRGKICCAAAILTLWMKSGRHVRLDSIT